MRKIFIGMLVAVIIVVSGCSKDSHNDKQADNKQQSTNKQKNNKYQSKIDEILSIQQKKHQDMVKSSDKVNPEFKKERVNRYVYNDGKLIIISYPLYKGNNKLFYAAYEYKNDKIYYKRGFNAKAYVEQHKPDYKDIKVK